MLKFLLILQGQSGNLDLYKLSLFLLWVKMLHQQKTVKTLTDEAFTAEPGLGTTLGAAVGAMLCFGWLQRSEAEHITSGREQC